MLERLEEPVDAVITTSAGYPLDLTYYQSLKGITAAQHILRPGGRILLIASCDEGPGAPEFRRMLKDFPSAADFLDKIADAPVIVDQWQLEKLALVNAEGRLCTTTFPVCRRTTIRRCGDGRMRARRTPWTPSPTVSRRARRSR